MLGVYSIAPSPTQRGRATWAAWWTVRPTRARFVPADARGEAVDEHAARQAAFAAFAKARGCTSWSEIAPIFAVAAERWSRNVEPVFPGDRRRVAKPIDAPLDLSDDAREVLGLSGPVTLESARDAYRKRALELHPDRGGSHEAMLQLNAVWERIRRQLENA